MNCMLQVVEAFVVSMHKTVSGYHFGGTAHDEACVSSMSSIFRLGDNQQYLE